MFISLLSHLVCAWFAFALPAYNTYKALAHNQQTNPSYWIVIALFVAFENTLGLVLSWFPFYWELRTIFLLYISLPQTQGFIYVYSTFLEPWLSSNEAGFDEALASAQNNTIAFCRTRITAFLDLVWSILNNTPVSAPPGDVQKHPRDHLTDLWAAYSPFVLGAFAAKDTSDAHVTSNPYSVNGDSS
ncbi:TB2/DP1, HVA22 family-domain-containing protein [Chiua virens]|nr:TB2/DP1, HVA22 family-domain-containing protein [Chiua virens]